MARTRVRFGRVGALVGAVLVAANLVAQAAGGEPAPAPQPRTNVLVVQPGDTVWEIAREMVGPEGDPRPLVTRIRRLNDLEGRTLRAGTRLALPEA